ncbi:MAG: M23 family metallopeptidase [Thermales bacterium]|nr:M23 family metallopeptidase [Thermales bacterium]
MKTQKFSIKKAAGLLVGGIAAIFIAQAEAKAEVDNLPFTIGKQARISRGYYSANNPNVDCTDHGCGSRRAIDFATNENIDIITVRSGTVLNKGCYTITGYGCFVMIKNNLGSVDTYAHLANNSITAPAIGQQVSKAQKLGVIGNTGNSTGQHLHFERNPANGNSNQPNYSSSIVVDFAEINEQQSEGQWVVSQNDGNSSSQVKFDFGDLDVDSRSNIAWRQGNNLVTWMIDDETGTNINNPVVNNTIPAGFKIIGYAQLTRPNWGSNKNIILQNPTTGATKYWVNNPNGTFHSEVSLPFTFGWQLLGPVKGIKVGQHVLDGLLWKSTTSGDVVLWRFNDSHNYHDSITLPNMNDWAYLGSGSFQYNLDSHQLWRRNSDNQLAFWIINSNGQLVGTNWINQNPSNWEFVGLGRFTSELLDNLIWRSGTGTHLWKFNPNGNGQFQNHVSLPNTVGWDPIGVGKFRNTDPKENLVWKNPAGETVHLVLQR